jgi:hypothetical protein
MLNVAGYFLRSSRNTLNRVFCVIALSLLGMSAVASTGCDSLGDFPSNQPEHSALTASSGHGAEHGPGPDCCQQTLYTCATAASTMTALPSAQNPSLPDAATAPLHFRDRAFVPSPPRVAVSLLPLFPLYLQTSRLLI